MRRSTVANFVGKSENNTVKTWLNFQPAEAFTCTLGKERQDRKLLSVETLLIWARVEFEKFNYKWVYCLLALGLTDLFWMSLPQEPVREQWGASVGRAHPIRAGTWKAGTLDEMLQSATSVWQPGSHPPVCGTRVRNRLQNNRKKYMFPGNNLHTVQLQP